MRKIRVLIADDSAFARDMLRGFLDSDSKIQVVGEAKNGEEAVRLAIELKPDLVTMDLEMPVMDGMEAIAEIMARRAVPILVISSVADAKKAYAAVAQGALDAINKPELDVASGAALIARIKMLATVPVITHLRSGSLSKGNAGSVHPIPATLPASAESARLFGIASSTGGPQALALILGMLPAFFPSAILISQHIADGFAGGMADWLSSICKLPVRLAREGEPVAGGTVYVSPSDTNLIVTPTRRIGLAQRLPGEIYHPTCDVLLASVAAVYGRHGVGIILTGMGSDGAAGITKIFASGGATLAQDEASSVIFGMNRVAIERGGVQQVLPADAIAQTMCRLAGLTA